MNQKQKLGYMVLGAGIMAVGITIGQFITPNIEAQSNGVFDEIVCKKLSVVDEEGNKAIDLSTDEGARSIMIYDKEGIPEIILDAGSLGTTVTIHNKETGGGISLFAEEVSSGIWVRHKGRGHIDLSIDEESGEVAVYGKFGAAYLKSGLIGSGAAVYYHDKGGIGLSAREFWNRITINDGAGQIQWEAP